MGELVKFSDVRTGGPSSPAVAPLRGGDGGSQIVPFRHIDLGIVVETVRVLRLIDDRTLLDAFNRRSAR